MAVTNLAMGLVYLGIGAMTVVDFRRGLRNRGFSYFGAALIGLAFTCGPHHVVHGLHVGFEGRPARGLDLVAVVVGLAPGCVFAVLRVEAFRGGAGDRLVRGTPSWLAVAPVVAAAYVACLIAVVRQQGIPFALTPGSGRSLLLAGLYSAIAWVLLSTQVTNRTVTGGWSTSGLALAGIFSTCAVMHAIWGLYAAAGDFVADSHDVATYWASVAAGLYFLWVVRGLRRGALSDWNNDAAREHPATEVLSCHE